MAQNKWIREDSGIQTCRRDSLRDGRFMLIIPKTTDYGWITCKYTGYFRPASKHGILKFKLRRPRSDWRVGRFMAKRN